MKRYFLTLTRLDNPPTTEETRDPYSLKTEGYYATLSELADILDHLSMREDDDEKPDIQRIELDQNGWRELMKDIDISGWEQKK